MPTLPGVRDMYKYKHWKRRAVCSNTFKMIRMKKILKSASKKNPFILYKVSSEQRVQRQSRQRKKSSIAPASQQGNKKLPGSSERNQTETSQKRTFLLNQLRIQINSVKQQLQRHLQLRFTDTFTVQPHLNTKPLPHSHSTLV